MIMDELKKEFAVPSAKYRPIPFWSWNDGLDAGEIRKQVGELKEGGVGGYFMHARSGLKTEYLSDEWFDCIGAGIDEGAKKGLGAWIYDEEGWPSGFAGGRVPELGEDYQAKFITLQDMKNTSEEGFAFVYCISGDGKRYRRVNAAEKCTLNEGERLIGVRRHVNPFYIDTMNRRAVQAFLSCTHEEYYRRFSQKFGGEMKGFFTDEPRLTCNNFGELPWSDDLPEVFLKTYNYDIRGELPALFMKTAGCRRVRYDFWCTVSRMFSENYMKTIQSWCHDHNCLLTGHIMMEESIFSQMTSTGGVMPFYEYEDIPGIDWLRRCIDTPVTPKQVGSVACQLGKKQVLTESFALCGWGVTFEELKWIADWQFVNGVNQICQHLMAYDIRGVRKRDYPPSHFYQQTWWKDAALFNDYLARECVALSYGDQTADVLLLHPMRSGFIAYDGTRTDELKALDEEFVKASVTLSGQHISYHYGDETIIARYGRVSGASFIVGRIAYRTVILPYMLAIDGYTLRLLNSFADNGGRIISFGRLPEFTNGEMGLLDALKGKVTQVSYREIRSVLAASGALSISIAADDGTDRQIMDISYEQRRENGSELYFIVNHSREKAYDTHVIMYGAKGNITEMRADDGSTAALAAESDGKRTEFSLRFEPMQSHIIFAGPGKGGEAVPEPEKQYIAPGKQWDIVSMGVNSITLDRCDYRVDDGEWKCDTPVIKVQNALLELKRPCNVSLRFAFFTDFANKDEKREMCLIAEDAAKYDICVNGVHTAPEDLDGCWKDRSFSRVRIDRYVHDGRNEITMDIAFRQPQKVYDVLFGENVYETEKNKITYDVELESVYITGNFAVYAKDALKAAERHAYTADGPFCLTDMPEHFDGLELTHQGLLFYADVLKVSQKLNIRRKSGKRQVLKLGAQRAPLIKVYVNGRLVKNSMWAPYEADITDYLADGSGDNVLTLELFATNRNLLGPHHHINGECYNVGPESFTGKWSWVERSSEADATDIRDRDKNYWTDSFSFIKFGLEELH